MRKLLLILLLSVSGWAQNAGLPPEWEVRKELETLDQMVDRFGPLLDRVKPETWEGAPEGYRGQAERVRTEVGYLQGSVKALGREPERLTVALESYFRLVAVDAMLRSLEAGIRRYQSSAMADLLQGMLGESAAELEKLKQYVTDLAADREQHCRVANQEAQRCRGILSRQPAGSRPAAEKKE